MILYSSLNEIKENRPGLSVCALGNFDGIHKGHQKLIETAVSKARKKGIRSSVFTFSEHPINVMSGHTMVKTILKPEDKFAILESMGVDYVFNLPFSDEIRTLSPEDFARDLLKRDLNIDFAVCGFNFTFGYKAGGKHDDLISYGKEFGFGAEVIDPVEVDGVIACMFDRDALGVTNYKRRTTTHYNAKGEFTNYFHKQDCGYFNDYDENFVVFFIK